MADERASVFPHGQIPGSLELAFVGDSVYDLYVRSALVTRGGRVNDLNRAAVARVNAHAQCESLKRILSLLSPEESAIVRRAHNARQSPTKNADRMEWLLEKAIEIGICSLTFLQCDHSERTHLNLERLQRLAIAALKQSQTTWLPPLKTMKFADFIQQNIDTQADKFIAWCDENNQRQLVDMPRQFPEMILLIGPEGDFSEEEIALARESGYTEVKLGDRRLRTETAGLYGCLVAGISRKNQN